MIDEALAALRRWRENRDREEARDLNRKEARLRWAVERMYAKREDYEREYQAACNLAWRNHLEANGVTTDEWMPGWTRYHKGGKTLWEYELIELRGSCPWPAHNPPQRTEPEAMDMRELDVTRLQLQGLTREQAEEAKTKEEAENERIRLWALRPGPGIRTVNASCDPRRPRMIPEAEYNQLAGIPERDEIVALGPA